LSWRLCWPQGLLQRRLPGGLPTIERLARNAESLTEVRDLSIAAARRQQVAHPLCSLAGCATMPLYHGFLPASYGDRFSLPYSPGSPLATPLAHTVKFFRSFLNFATVQTVKYNSSQLNLALD